MLGVLHAPLNNVCIKVTDDIIDDVYLALSKIDGIMEPCTVHYIDESQAQMRKDIFVEFMATKVDSCG